jgi:hypothetical protein
VHARSASMDISWDHETRVATVRCARGSTLTGEDGATLVEALAGWIGPGPEPFALLAFTGGVRGTDAQYRARARVFFSAHREHAFIAAVEMGPVIRVIAEMFRMGTGLQLKGFAHETEARAWLRGHGIRA